MVGNTYSYTRKHWAEDIRLAASNCIDGFALNVGRDPWQPKQVAAAFAAARGSSFKLFLSFDMTSLVGSCAEDATILKEYILAFAESPNQLKWDGKIVVSTFGGEGCTFGQNSVDEGWRYAIKTGVPPVHFVPSFFDAQSATYPVVDGLFNWNGGWPMGNHAVDFDSDDRHIAGCREKTFMAAHYGPSTWNKNWIYRGDDWLYNTRWEMLFHKRSQIDIVQILTWNDYGESHYIGPIRADQPNSQAWVDGFDHQGWLELTSYYATAFKTGTYPIIKQDRLFLWARPHAAAAEALEPAAPRPHNADWTEDYLWAVVFAASPAKVTLTSGLVSQSFDVSHGVTKLKLASRPGLQSAVLARNNVNMVTVAPDGFTFTKDPKTYNFNAFVAVSIDPASPSQDDAEGSV